MNDMETEKPLGFSAMRRIVDPIGYHLTECFHLLGLFAISGAAVWAAMKAFFEMTTRGHASIEDLLFLFIYTQFTPEPENPSDRCRGSCL
jgi:protein PsiE